MEGVHFLLTYRCPYECEHCFLYCGPRAPGTFSVTGLRKVFADISRAPSIRGVYFEGGEPFLVYPLMLEGMRLARRYGLESGIVTNCYWATSLEDAKLWLRPLKRLGLSRLTISEDAFHGAESRPRNARMAAEAMGIDCGTISVQPPDDRSPGGVLLKGRAGDRLAEGLPRKPASSFTTCPHEDLVDPGRVHVDPYGEVFVCQGISIGNCFRTPIGEIMGAYRPNEHPICGPLISGGPARLAMEWGIDVSEGFVDECHCCYSVRQRLLDRFPHELTPRQVYGL